MEPPRYSTAKAKVKPELAMEKLFFAHPRAQHESYLQHLTFTVLFACRLVAAAFCLLIHGLVPHFFTTTSSKMVERINEIFQNRSMGADGHEPRRDA